MYLKRVLMLHDKIENSEAYPFSIPSIHSMEEINFASQSRFLWVKMVLANQRCLKPLLINVDFIQLAEGEIICMM